MATLCERLLNLPWENTVFKGIISSPALWQFNFFFILIYACNNNNVDVCHYRALNKGEEQNSVKCILLGKKNPTGLIGNPGFTSCPVLEVWF